MSWTNMELLPLVCLCLLTWSGTTFADGNETEIRVLEGRNATLPCSLSSRESIGLRRIEWKKDGQEVLVYDGSPLSGQDPQFRGRVSYSEDGLRNGNASITIRDTKVADSGNYTCEFSGRQTSHIQLVVDGPLKDRRGENITGAVSRPHVKLLGETEDGVQLQCDVDWASFKPLVQWRDRAGNNLTAKEPQGSEQRGNITLQTTVTKSGYYRCVATQKEISHQMYHETYVPVPGAGVQLHGSDDVSRKVMIGLIAAVLAELL